MVELLAFKARAALRAERYSVVIPVFKSLITTDSATELDFNLFKRTASDSLNSGFLVKSESSSFCNFKLLDSNFFTFSVKYSRINSTSDNLLSLSLCNLTNQAFCSLNLLWN